MWKCVFLFSHLFVFSISTRVDNEIDRCDLRTSTWTSWFNSQHPSNMNGNDIEDFRVLREYSDELTRCSSVVTVDYSIVHRSEFSSQFYQTIINSTGVFCRVNSSMSSCPDYRVRFCCSLSKPLKTIPQCGQTFRQPNLQSRIINGIEAVPHSHPWAVSLQYKGEHDCGGAIIDQWHIVTAAHCLDYANDLRNYYARIGAHHRLASGQLMPIEQLFLHPNYNELSSTNDIGVIRLAVPITFTPEIQPICLVDHIVDPPLGTTAFVVGWGQTVYQVWNSSSLVLRQARLRVVADCSMYYAFDPQRQICAASNGPNDKDHGSCQGDSGGALLFSQNGRWYAGGVVSYAIGCGRPAFPTVFTKSSAYVDWIRAITNRPING